jgi:hypothetical protein
MQIYCIVSAFIRVHLRLKFLLIVMQQNIKTSENDEEIHAWYYVSAGLSPVLRLSVSVAPLITGSIQMRQVIYSGI